MKLTFTDLNDMIRELKEKSVQSIRVNEMIRDVQVMIPDDYPMPIKTFSVYITASIDSEWNDDLSLSMSNMLVVLMSWLERKF